MQSMTTTINIKNLQNGSDHGLVMWSKNARHRLPLFVPFAVLKGIDLWKAAQVKVSYHRSDAGRLIASGIEVLKSK